MHGLVLQLLISLAGVAAMIAICAALFGTGDAVLAGPGDAARRIAADVAGFLPGKAALSADRRAALVENARDASVHLAVICGDGVVTRRIPAGTRTSREGGRLVVELADFTLEPVTLDLGQEAPAWQARIEGRMA